MNGALQLGWKMGLEPTTPGTTIQCSDLLSYSHHFQECKFKYFFTRGTTPL